MPDDLFCPLVGEWPRQCRQLYLIGAQDVFENRTVVQCPTCGGGDHADAECRVQQHQALDFASSAAELNGKLVGYDAPEGPAENLVRPCGISRLEPVRIACGHGANR